MGVNLLILSAALVPLAIGWFAGRWWYKGKKR
jgi:hypothetical protein